MFQLCHVGCCWIDTESSVFECFVREAVVDDIIGDIPLSAALDEPSLPSSLPKYLARKTQ